MWYVLDHPYIVIHQACIREWNVPKNNGVFHVVLIPKALKLLIYVFLEIITSFQDLLGLDSH